MRIESSMLPASRSGTAPFTLSVLDNVSNGVGETVAAAYEATIELARTADSHGYHRFWMSEHHAMPGASTPAPQMMVARLVGETTNIRLGAGGIMLPNHSPLVIAEQFGMLEAMAPGRIDLGLGRAPGTDPATAAALRRQLDANEHFPQQIAELTGFINDDFPDSHPYRNIHAVPGPWQAQENRVAPPSLGPEIWILGSSPYSAQIAGHLGRPYAFALQFGDADVHSAMKLYRDSFRPSAFLDEPYSMVSASVIAHDDPDEALRQASTSAMAMLRMFQRKSFTLFTPEEVAEYPATLQERQIIDTYVNRTITGDGAQVAQQLEQLHELTGVDEIMMVLLGHSPSTVQRTVEIVAEYYGMKNN